MKQIDKLFRINWDYKVDSESYVGCLEAIGKIYTAVEFEELFNTDRSVITSLDRCQKWRLQSNENVTVQRVL